MVKIELNLAIWSSSYSLNDPVLLAERAARRRGDPARHAAVVVAVVALAPDHGAVRGSFSAALALQKKEFIF